MEYVIDLAPGVIHTNEGIFETVKVLCSGDYQFDVTNIPHRMHVRTFRSGCDLEHFTNELRLHLLQARLSNGYYGDKKRWGFSYNELQRVNKTTFIKSIVPVKGMSAMGYYEDEQDYWEIQYTHSFIAQNIRGWIEREYPEYEVYNCFDNVITSFQALTGIGSFDKVPRGTSKYVSYNQFTYEKAKNGQGIFGIYRSLTLDIEVPAKKYTDEDTKNAVHPISCIGCLFVNEKDELTRRIFYFGPFLENSTIEDKRYEDEYTMLCEFNKWVIATDPQFIYGYNSNTYDIPYIFGRFRKLNIDYSKWSKVDRCFPVLKEYEKDGMTLMNVECPGRIFVDILPLVRTKLKLPMYTLDAVARDQGLGCKDDIKHSQLYEYYYEGGVVKRDMVLAYCMQDVALTWKLAKKLKIFVQLISTCRLMRVRCSDSMIRGRTFLIFQYIYANFKDRYFFPNEHPNRYLNTVKGLPFYIAQNEAGEKYEGAYVLDPTFGLYEGLITTLDFNSLYPSIIIEHNLCPSTNLVYSTKFNYTANEKRDAATLDTFFTDLKIDDNGRKTVKKANLNVMWDDGITIDPEKVLPPHIVTPLGFAFVTKDVKEGIMPQFCRVLKESRALINAELEQEPDPDIRAALDIYQKEIKTLNNSGYGMHGTNHSKLCHFGVAASITAYGKYYIMGIVDEIQKRFSMENRGKFEIPALVVNVRYGDTDSMFMHIRCFHLNGDGVWVEQVKFTPEESWTYSERLQYFVNVESKVRVGELKMGIDDVSSRVILYAKKKYFKRKITKKEKTDKNGNKYIEYGQDIKVMGIDTREVYPFCRKVIKYMFQIIANEDDFEECKRKVEFYIWSMYTLLVSGNVPRKEFIRTKKLSKPIEEYDNDNEAHVRCARILLARGDTESQVKVGERIPYYHCQVIGLKSNKTENVIPMLVADEDGYEIDYEEYASIFVTKLSMYLENVIFSPIEFRDLFDYRRYPIRASKNPKHAPQILESVKRDKPKGQRKKDKKSTGKKYRQKQIDFDVAEKPQVAKMTQSSAQKAVFSKSRTIGNFFEAAKRARKQE